MKIPGPDHPIAIAPAPGQVTVSFNGHIIARTRAALSLREASYPEVLYVPRSDADMGTLERTDHLTYCPYKGDCNYFTIAAGGEHAQNAVWTYEAPYEAVAQIKDHLAFYPDRVAITRE